METKFKIIETPNYILAVSDEAGEIGCLRIEYMPHKPHCYTRIYNSLNGTTIYLFDKEVWKGEAGFTYEIIAYQSKGNASELDLPLLPEINVEDDFELELKDFKSSNVLDILNMGNINYLSNGDIIYNPDLIFIKRNDRWFSKHKAATKVYTEDDLRKAFQAGEKFGGLPFSTDKTMVSENDYIQSLKQPKTSKWFVAEAGKIIGCKDPMICLRGCDIGTESCKQPILDYSKLKTTTINGKTYLVGKYLYE
jgi:hypothetical protein